MPTFVHGVDHLDLQAGGDGASPRQEANGAGASPPGVIVPLEEFSERTAEIGAMTCRVELDNAHLGTGFLVGRQVVLTNWHVVSRLTEAEQARLECRFDYVRSATGTRPGKVVPVAKPTVIADSPFNPAEVTTNPTGTDPDPNQLDFALLRLAEPEGERRGWINLTDGRLPLPKGTPLLIVQHPRGKPLMVALHTNAVVGFNEAKTRLRYSAVTERGSSGSPCFTADWDLVAVHHMGDPDWTPGGCQGIPADLIRAALVAKGKGAEIAPYVRPRLDTSIDVVIATFRALEEIPKKRALRGFKNPGIRNLHVALHRLAAYKVIHDALHRIQLELRPARLDDAARTLSEDIEPDTALTDFHDVLRRGCVSISGQLDAIAPATDERRWLARLEDLSVRIEQALESRDRSLVRFGLRLIQDLVGPAAASMNDRIRDTANGLTLDELVAALEAAAPNQSADLQRGANSVREINRTVLERVGEHGRWQAVERELAALGRELTGPVDEVFDNFVAFWAITKPNVEKLMATAAESKWARTLATRAKTIDNQLLKLDQLLTEKRIQRSDPAIPNALNGPFDLYRREALFRFYVIDATLKTDCQALVRLSEPLRTVLEKLRQ